MLGGFDYSLFLVYFLPKKKIENQPPTKNKHKQPNTNKIKLYIYSQSMIWMCSLYMEIK